MRLGVEDRFKESTLSFEVSIPAWCDWEADQAKKRNYYIMFQFQLGAIGSYYSY